MTRARDLANAGPAFANVDATELGYLNGVTSAVQTQIDSKEPLLPSQTGNSGKFLTTDGTNDSWGTASSMTVIASGNLSGALSLTSIPGTYKSLVFRMLSPQLGTQAQTSLTLNSVATGYAGGRILLNGGTVSGLAAATSIGWAFATATGTTTSFAELILPGYANATGVKKFTGFSSVGSEATLGNAHWFAGLNTGITAAITTIACSSSFTGGSYVLYGVN